MAHRRGCGCESAYITNNFILPENCPVNLLKRQSVSNTFLRYSMNEQHTNESMLFILDIMRVTFVTRPLVTIAELPTTSFNSQGLSLQGLQKGLPSTQAAHKKLSIHAGRNTANCFPGPEK